MLHEHSVPLLHAPHGAPRDQAATALAILVALGVAVALFGIVTTLGADDTADSSSRTDTSTSTPSPTATGEPTAASDEDLTSCRALCSQQQDVLAAARPAMKQWDTHIAAMNQLVAGKITLAQATAFWDRTRVGARRNLAAYATADERLSSRASSPSPTTLPAPAEAAPELEACLDAVAAARTTIDAARTTMATWRHHVHDMERLRAGTLSPAAAQKAWLRTWRQGDRELRVYERRDRVAEQLRCAA